MRRDHEAMKLP